MNGIVLVMFRHVKHWLALALGGDAIMKTQMRNCIITSEDGNNYMVRRSDLFLFIWRFGLKRHSSLFNITNQEGNINLYISKNAQIIINLCKIIEAAFICYVSFPFVMRLALILPSY